MNPIAFQIGPLAVHWYGIIIACGLLLGVTVAAYRAPKYEISRDDLYNLVLIALPCGILGARLWYVIFNWSYYAGRPGEILATWHGGLAIHGGVLAAIICGLAYAKWKKLSFWGIADLTAPSFALAQSIGRWGNYVNQEAYGTITDLPWAITIAGEKRHPTFLYESIWNLSLFVFLLFIAKRFPKFQGLVFAGYLVLYSVGRFFVEGLRTDSLMVGGLRTAQVVSLCMVIVGLIIGIWSVRRMYTREKN